MSFFISRHPSDFASITATNTVLVGPIDVQHYDKFCVQFQNEHTSISFIDMTAEVAFHSAGSPTSAAPNWVAINTSILAVPSALANTAAFISTAVDSCYRWLRFKGSTDATASAGLLVITLTGHGRR